MKALYMTDCYIKEFDAAVEEKDGKSVVLNDTAFYPGGGGQPCDLGTMEAGGTLYNVVNGSKKGGRIWHELDREAPPAGAAVRCKIDWERRYRLMRMHTAAHIIFTILYNRAGALATGNQLDVSQSRLDLSLETFDRDTIQKHIDEANSIIQQGIDVRMYFLKRDEALKIPGAVKLANVMPPEVEELRIVEIPGVDMQADGGTHVRNTREIGKITLLKIENKGKNNRRIYYSLEP